MNSLRQELMLAAAIETLQEGENLLAPTDLEREFEDHLKVIYAITFMLVFFSFHPSIPFQICFNTLQFNNASLICCNKSNVSESLLLLIAMVVNYSSNQIVFKHLQSNRLPHYKLGQALVRLNPR
jgi:hypothetical protein